MAHKKPYRDDEEAALPLRHFKPRSSIKYGVTGDEDSLYFKDGRRRIDFVLVYRTGKSRRDDEKREVERAEYQEQIEHQGIDFELDTEHIPGEGPDVNLCFVKLHATWDLLTRYADIMKIRMPLKREVEDYPDDEVSRYCPAPLRVDRTLLPRLPHYISTGFSKSKEALFNIPDRDSFFSPSQRNRIIWECLSRIQYDENNHAQVGIQKLLASGTFQAAYPLHDGPWISETETTKPPSNLRSVLYDQWGRFGKMFKFQPVAYIRNYFGERVGFYFAWMEFYTLMLILPAIVGFICFLYGGLTVNGDVPSTEICMDQKLGDTVMCPICEAKCPYWRLRDSCHYSKSTYLIDNPGTIFFATFMALWSSLFILLWRRKQAILSWNFDTLEVLAQEEPVRPELEARVKPEEWKVNPVTGVKEPLMSSGRLFLQNLLSGTVVLFMVFLVFASTLAFVAYRITLNIALYAQVASQTGDNFTEGQVALTKYSTYIVSISAAVLNLIVILILNALYFWIAKWLTEREYPRTQTEFDNSLTLKYYVFEFVNTYTSVFYVAFLKGRYPAGVPGARILGDVPVDRCDKGGCLIELTIQLGVLFLGSNFSTFVQEIIVPWIFRRYRKIRRKDKHLHRWEADYELAKFPVMGLFLEYSRMVTQFGFITMFVAAFPIAPIFALINNITEIRINAYKYLTFFRRPVALWTRNIGAWGRILENVARFSVITNAFVVAFTSDFVPKIAYMTAYSVDSTLHGYVNWTLSMYDTGDFPVDAAPLYPGGGEKPIEASESLSCWYQGFRTPPWDRKKYGFTATYWNILAARVILVLVFEHFVMVVTKLISFFVPDMPASLKIKVLRENFLAKEAFYDAESRKQEPLRRLTTRSKGHAPVAPRTEL